MSRKSILKAVPLALLLFAFLSFYSCKKSNVQSDKDENVSQDLQTIPDNNFNESNEDLMTVDYKEFYDELSPHGEWVEVSAADLGISMKSDESSGNKSLARFIGVEDLYAANLDLGTFFVWKPSDNLEVGLTAGNPGLAVLGTDAAPVTYVPYTNGQWVNTDQGWYFQGATPYEETVHHYGRWIYSPDMGWVWMPGRVWSPAWVDWRMNDNYVAWAPVPPNVYIVNDVMTVPVIPAQNYVVVEQRYFAEPQIVTYYNSYLLSNPTPFTVVQQMTPVQGVTVINNTIINRGPDVVTIERVYGRPINVVQINKVKIKSDVKYTGNVFNVYTPTFNRVKYKEHVKTTITQPKKYMTVNDIKRTSSGRTNTGKTDKSYKNDEKVTGKNKGQNTPLKTDDNRKMNTKQNKGSENKDTYKQNKGSQNKGNENKGSQNKGNQNKGNENKGKQKKGSYNENNGSQDKGKQNKSNESKGSNDQKSSQDKGSKGNHGKGK
jgi:uncharacterized protein DUF6600